jgi:hypothetical protein
MIFTRKRSGLPIDGSSTETGIYYYEGSLRKAGAIKLQKLPNFADRNWLSLFNYDRASRLVSIVEGALHRGLLRYLGRHEIVRGVEMYGPDFFFIPNTYWLIINEDEDLVTIGNRNSGVKLVIPRKYLVECLRKPEYYSDRIYISNPRYYILAIDEEPEEDLRRYIRWGEEMKVPALRFGKDWYRHPWRQLQTKKPFGHVFIHDKVDLKRHKIIVNFMPL